VQDWHSARGGGSISIRPHRFVENINSLGGLRYMSVKLNTCTRLVAISAGLLLLCGCDGDLFALKNDKVIHTSADTAEPLIDKAAGIGVKTVNDPLTVTDDVWVGDQSIRMRRGQPLPVKFDSENGFNLVSAGPMSLAMVATQIAGTTNIPVRIGDMQLDPGATSAAATAIPAPSPTSGTGDVNSMAAASQILGGDSSENVKSTTSLSFRGPLSGFLDQLASQFDVSWRYDGQGIYLYRYETQNFNVEAMPAISSIDDNFDASNSSSTSSSSNGGATSPTDAVKQSSDLKTNLDYWKEVEGSVKNILGSDGAINPMPSSGVITVTARPNKLAQVARYLDEENRRLGRQVAIDVAVYDVTLQDTNSYGLNLQAVFGGEFLKRALGKNADSTIAASGPSVPADPSGLTAGGLSFALLGRGWSSVNGTQDSVAQALSTVGNVAVLTRSPVVTLNNRPASRKIALNTSYISSSTTTLTPSGNSTIAQTTVTPGSFSTGFTLQLLPRLLEDGRVLLQYSIDLSDLVTLQSITQADPNGGTDIVAQLPTLDNKVFVQQAVMQEGATLVLSGFERTTNNDNGNGVGAATNWLMGGISNNTKREQLVIAITPHEVTPQPGSLQAP